MVVAILFSDFIQTIGVLAALIFVLTSMLGMGFLLAVSKISALICLKQTSFRIGDSTRSKRLM
jgi:hypothetical protein